MPTQIKLFYAILTFFNLYVLYENANHAMSNIFLLHHSISYFLFFISFLSVTVAAAVGLGIFTCTLCSVQFVCLYTNTQKKRRNTFRNLITQRWIYLRHSNNNNNINCKLWQINSKFCSIILLTCILIRFSTPFCCTFSRMCLNV